jgi:hypothetical protein
MEYWSVGVMDDRFRVSGFRKNAEFECSDFDLF